MTIETIQHKRHNYYTDNNIYTTSVSARKHLIGSIGTVMLEQMLTNMNKGMLSRKSGKIF